MRHPSNVDLFDLYQPDLTLPESVNFGEGSGMYETFGEDLDLVRKVAVHEARRVWTLVDTDDGGTAFINGYHYVNRIAYAITTEAGQEDESFLCTEGEEEDTE